MAVLPLNRNSIRRAAEIVRRGGVIAYPTDTVYGLGCDPFNEQALKKLIEAKGRRAKPLPLLVSSRRHASRIGFFDKRAGILAKKFWPGQLTIVVAKKTAVPRIATTGHGSVGIRQPDHPALVELIERCGGVLIGTSANISGKPACTTAGQVQSELTGRVDLILDGGPSPKSAGSTVVDVSTRGKVRVLRPGPITENEIRRALGGGRQKRFEARP